ncbi:MAG: hypothetical protein NAG76_16070 [Candidatus Pristimantibacillus lignocellulolyticus]|uniref:Uncharacterized protein n=1 Tax=Candidatus Pristimantibacillus lignocellulolyticus TaxID=2994561 RepID=A0A9J6ZB68_9BACL|nr:MAG: hypothetical protein NAG76_16070 [Candidatus Pristimantibacillus lignocellulolyticus]
MDKLKNSGFYKIKFFIRPEEFKNVLKLLEYKQAQFHLTNYAQTEHNLNQVYEAYRTFYHYYAAEEKRNDGPPFFVYSISVASDNESSGFFARNEGIHFPYCGQWAEDELPCILLSFPKGFQIDLVDDKGKYYIYENIRDHKPLTYTFLNEITGFIKKMTKPLRFSAHDAEAMKEQKPSVRISPDAIHDLRKSWIFSKYGLVINGK